MKQIIQVVDIAAPRKKVYDAIATREGLAGWWSTKVNGGEEKGGTNTFLFELRESSKGTSLRFTQTYARELELDVYGTYNFNWGFYLDSLAMLVEKGKGKPFES